MELEQTPNLLPIFPLPGCLLLPRANMPLHIFEPRYRAMVTYALENSGMIGMVQPKNLRDPSEKPEIYETGCLGKISSFQETDDGRYFLVLTGVCRFNIEEELPTAQGGFRIVSPRFEEYLEDLCPPVPGFLDRVKLFEKLKAFAVSQEINISWEELRKAEDEELLNAVAMGAPFDPSDKQALLESSEIEKRASMLVAMLDVATHQSGEYETDWLQ
ncbi:MAG: peptidase S16 [Deltaproteobacteria bacterium]|nr:peptidase S16 [Deltaproteobacteria bacterium]MBT6435197.1 peptidase S16 [Deltaproteobacteria bacterium]